MARRNFVARGQFPGNRSVNTIVSDYKKFVGVVESEVFRIMQTVAEMTLEATLPFVPEQYGGLRESGRAEAIQTPKGVMARVSFGGVDAPVTPTPNAPTGFVNYAAIVNYDITKEHPVGESLFMEKGALNSKDEVDAYIKSELRKIKL
jgi:hypothetical protein